jgi:hypothetical protein
VRLGQQVRQARLGQQALQVLQSQQVAEHRLPGSSTE